MIGLLGAARHSGQQGSLATPGLKITLNALPLLTDYATTTRRHGAPPVQGKHPNTNNQAPHMKQLSAADGQLIQVETADAPEHIATLTIYDQSTAPGGLVRFKDILRTFESRLLKSPIFTNKIARVPLDLDHPYWVRDSHFDLEYHLRHIALPQPGDWRQLCIQVARLHAHTLDLSRPLWQAYVIEGLNNVEGVPKNSFAIYIKIHHAAADGMAAADFYQALHDLKPKAVKGTYGSILQNWEVPEEPGKLKLLGASARRC